MPNRLSLSDTVALAVVVATLAGLIPSGAARAADLDPPYLGSQAYPEDKVEFGSGWYIRGDLGATRLPEIRTGSSALLSDAQAAQVFNAGGDPQLINIRGTAGTTSIANGSDLGYTASLGAGYKFNSWFRGDIIADFHKPVVGTASNGDVFCQTGIVTPQVLNSGGVAAPTTGACSGAYSAKLSSYDVLANIYLDLGTWSVFTPYVGAGAGLSFGHYQTSSVYTQGNNVHYNVTYTDQSGGTTSENFDRTASGTYYSFAWALMAGVGIDIYDHTKLDLGYRYLNLGRISGFSGTLYSHEVRAGIRYMIDD